MMILDASLGIAALIAFGIASGFISGMLGVGGGTMVVPALIFGLPLFGVTGPDIPKIAIATSLALVVPTSIASAQAHAAKGGIDWWLLALLAPSVVAGAVTQFVAFLNVKLLILVFVLFALFTACNLLRRRRECSHARPEPGLTTITIKGVLGGALSSVLGLGVGFFAVPLLARFVALPRAIGTAAALGLPMALAGTASYLLATTPDGCEARCAGYVFLPAVAAIGISAVLAAPLGAWAAHAFPARQLRQAFALFLMMAAASLAYKTFTIEMMITESNRVIANARRLVTPALAAMQPADVPAWIGAPVPEPYFELARRYGPQRSFLLMIIERGPTKPLAVRALFTDSSRPRKDWIATVTTPMDRERILANLATTTEARIETASNLGTEGKATSTAKRLPARPAHPAIPPKARLKRNAFEPATP